MQEGAFVLKLCAKESHHNESANFGDLQEARGVATDFGVVAQAEEIEVDGNSIAKIDRYAQLFGRHSSGAGVQAFGRRESAVCVRRGALTKTTGHLRPGRRPTGKCAERGKSVPCACGSILSASEF